MLAFLEFLAELYAGIMMFFSPAATGPVKRDVPLTLFNTLSSTKERFTADHAVSMYNCGPTVYGPQHIGNLSMFVFTDTLRRALEINGYSVRQVINFTDVGHLTSDADDGDDKMMKGLKREGLEPTMENMRVLAEKYANLFLEDIAALNIRTNGTQFPRASDHIPAQIEMVKTLEEKGFAYRGKTGVYFDTSKFPEYGKLGNINLEGLKEGARVAVVSDKRNPTDFLLWKLDTKMGWDSPWGRGFPGWHIECSAMIREILGDQIDIHTGGIEHIPVHHNNEIAQSEAATGNKPFVRFWLHRAHLQLAGGKIAKSEGNTMYLSDISAKGFHPLAFRYLLLGAHYRQPANFSYEALEAAQAAYLRLVKIVHETPEGGAIPSPYGTQFLTRINDDLDTAGALAVMWDMVNDKQIDLANLRAGLVYFDRVLGLNLASPDETATMLARKAYGETIKTNEAPQKVKDLLTKRELARKEKRWADADQARSEIELEGFVIEDTVNGPRLVAKY